MANGKRRKNKILSLINNDVVIEEENLLVEHATDYYKKLFGRKERSHVQLKEIVTPQVF